MTGNKSAGLAKVTPPKFERVLARERLFAVLDRKRARPVIWLTGPPGSGKTTLIASYLGAYPLPCLWYDIDEGDADAATFFYYLGVAAKQAAPSRRKPLPLLTPEYLPGLSTFTLRYFEDLYDQLKAPAILVLDNYQQVSADSVFHEIIAGGLARIPQGINMVLVSRTEPPSPLIRLRANNLMEEVGWPELRLTLQETEAMIRLQVEEMLPQESVQHLHSITGGWPAGVMLMLKTAQREQVDPRVLGAVSYEHIFDYFAAEILAKTDAQTKQFLLKTAFFPSMTPGMAEELTGLGSAERILSGLHRNNYFTLRYLSNPPAYEYHPLFREFLLTRAKEAFVGDEAVEIIQRAALLLEEAGQAEAAIELLCDIAAWDRVVPLVMKHSPEWLSQGRHLRLQEWLARLPVQLVERVPWISYWMGACYMATDPSRSRQYFEQAFERFRAQGEAAGLFLAWSGVVDAIFYSFEDFTRFDRWIEILEENMASFRKLPQEISVRVASSMLTGLMMRQPGHPDVEAWKERALSGEESSQSINTKALTLSHLQNYLLFKGDFAKAGAALESLQELSLSPSAGPLAQLTARHSEAMYYVTKGLKNKCLNSVSKGLELSFKTGVHALDRWFYGMAATSALDQEDSAEAEEWIKKMASTQDRPKSWDDAFYHVSKARQALLKNEYQKADGPHGLDSLSIELSSEPAYENEASGDLGKWMRQTVVNLIRG
jgi:LuxR family transcriptional regulator, maltose regulon positive regulatory protein